MATVLTEMPDVPRSWHEKEDCSIESYLLDNNIKCQQATPLKGGNSAYIWRLDGYQHPHQPHKHSRCAVFKYGDSEIKGMPDMKVSEGRMHTEVRALNTTIVQNAGSGSDDDDAGNGVQVPSVLQTTKEGFVMSWAGDIDLRTAFISNPSLDAAALGTKLGKWLADLHVNSVNSGEVGEEGWRNSLIEAVVDAEAKHLREDFRRRKISEDVIDRAVELLREPGEVKTLTICDFRPMNTLLLCKTTKEEEEKKERKSHADDTNPVATIVDWECTRYGDPAFDIRLWAAEALVLEAKYGKDRGLLKSFLKAYTAQARGSGIVGEEFVCRVAVVMGSILFWLMPLGIWDVKDEEEGERWRLCAIEYIRAGAERNMEWLGKSDLGPLLE